MLKKGDEFERFGGEAAEELGVEYNPLEYLLIALIDSNQFEDKQRRNRLRDAYKNITGTARKRADEPDSNVSKALFEYARLQEENYNNQLKLEHGGPEILSDEDENRFKEKTMHRLASLVAEKYPDENGNIHEYIYKRLTGQYGNKVVKEDPGSYQHALWARHQLYDAEAELKLFKDLERVAEILKPHGIHMDLRKAFWRIKF